ncbi:MAG TPA: anaerobic ribonucleoside-triphosphate reductase activating protein [Spirochaetota bacterium]|nr:anaerobic ribonucleoside-triphosphate reductase activating protein [Spirochaetota bacterium]HQO39590.1 anaerobic ribonucleoside-triphosphate reductase activating protein [Spirochaetota bacterium]
MNIRGLSKTSLVDFPGRISAVVFTGGCNMRCPFCHNAGLALGGSGFERITEDEIFAFLDKRKGLIDGVTITGGEPTLQNDLADFLGKIRAMGFLVKLDTNGLLPAIVSGIIERGLVDYIAVDIKSSPENYARATGVGLDYIRVKETIDLIRSSGVNYEARTTCVPGFVDIDDIVKAGEFFGRFKHWYLQQFVNRNPMIDPSLKSLSPYPVEYMKKMQAAASAWSDKCILRGV